jgi:cyclopropane fatty-acyl-phospholipid synthase-like methyltransferase
MLRDNRTLIKGRVCVESGCGMGVMSEALAKLGAAKVYAVEVNRHLFEIARERLAHYPNVEVIHSSITDFRPPLAVDVLLHEHYGQLLYDEELHLLRKLLFKPALVLPDGGRLRCGITSLAEMEDEVITPVVMRQLDGVLVSGLFDEGKLPLVRTCAEWNHGQPFAKSFETSLQGMKGDLLYFGLEVTHRGQVICQAGICDNWSYAWTPRTGDQFSLRFPMGERAPEVVFRWM